MAPQRQHILLIEADQDLRVFVERALNGPAYIVEAVAQGEAALARLEAETLALVLLDLVLPQHNGLELCERIRQRSQVPIIVFTPWESHSDKVNALHRGADDFLAAPFSVEELQARVRLALQRKQRTEQSPRPSIVHVGDLTINVHAGVVTRAGQPLRLSRTDWALLEFLVRHAGQVVTHRMLLHHVWGDAYTNEVGYLRTYIKRLRDVLEEDPHHPQYLQTESRLGYRFVIPEQTHPQPVEPVQQPSTPRIGALQIMNVRTPLTSFVGRQDELAAVEHLLRQSDVRLLTLTGPGGVGKTRLALHAGMRLSDAFRDGVCFVDLAHIRSSEMVVLGIARANNVKEPDDDALLDHLKAELSHTERLLLLDNFEQVSTAAAVVSELLNAAPEVKVLVTSRTPLHVQGEHEFAVPPLALPHDRSLTKLEELANMPVMALFVDRARAAKNDFKLTADNVGPIIEICTALDGLPLAIELAAARIKILSPQVIAARLSRRLAIVTGGPQDLPLRQQTLRNLLDWSYDLLAPTYRPLFARLAVFMGGGTLDAVEAICVSSGDITFDVLDGLSALVNASLLRSVDDRSGATRFTMLETIREYAGELLEESGGLPQMRQQHARYFLSIAEEAAPALRRAHNRQWLDRLERDHDNLRAALQWACDHDHEMLARFVGALWQFWHVHGHRQEARRWVDATLAQRTSSSPAVAAKALYGAGWLANDRREYQQAALYFEESLELLRRMGDTVSIPEVLRGLGELALSQADYGRAQALFDESLELGTKLGSSVDRAWSLHHLGRIALEQGDYERALTGLKESLTLFYELGDASGIAWSIHNLGRVALEQRDFEQAEQWLQQSLQLFDELGDKAGRAWSLQNVGRRALEQADIDSADELLNESLALFQELGDDLGTGWSLYSLGRVAAIQGNRDRAAAYFSESLALFQKVSDKPGIEWATFQQGQLVAV